MLVFLNAQVMFNPNPFQNYNLAGTRYLTSEKPNMYKIFQSVKSSNEAKIEARNSDDLDQKIVSKKSVKNSNVENIDQLSKMLQNLSNRYLR